MSWIGLFAKCWSEKGFCFQLQLTIFSLHIRSMWETICDAQAHSCTHSSNSKFLSKFSSWPFLEFQTVYPPNWKTSDLRWPKFTLVYPPQLKNFRFEMTKIYSGLPPPKWKTSDLRWAKFTLVYPPNEKLQIWDDQSLLRFTPPPQIVLQYGRSYVETNL